jgi:L-aminopeptidase/D-esterase-like protein
LTPLTPPGAGLFDGSAITDVPGLRVGHFTDTRRPTGCTVVLTPEGAVAGVDVRGAAPGTRETDLLAPHNSVERIHAVLLAGGSAFGLDAATGVMRWLDERGFGVPVGPLTVPIVPAAVLFDLLVGDARIRPDAAAGYAACEAAAAGAPAEGNVGAGSGALVGKIFGLPHAMKGGIGTASVQVGPVVVGALMAVNALGDVIDPTRGGCIVAGSRSADRTRLRDSAARLLAADDPQALLRHANTTVGVVATNAVQTKAQCQRMAQAAHDGLARTIKPAHTVADGDTVFALSTAQASDAGAPQAGGMLLATMAAQATQQAVLRAMWAAQSITEGAQHWPAALDWHASKAR